MIRWATTFPPHEIRQNILARTDPRLRGPFTGPPGGGGGACLFQQRHPADLLGYLFPMPWAGRAKAQGRAAARSARYGGETGGIGRNGARAGGAGEERSDAP